MLNIGDRAYVNLGGNGADKESMVLNDTWSDDRGDEKLIVPKRVDSVSTLS